MSFIIKKRQKIVIETMCDDIEWSTYHDCEIKDRKTKRQLHCSKYSMSMV